MYPEKQEEQGWTQSADKNHCQQTETKKMELHLTAAFRKQYCWHSRTRYNNNLSDPVSTKSQSTKHK